MASPERRDARDARARRPLGHRLRPRARAGLDPAQGDGLRPDRRHALRPRVSAFIKSLRGSDPDAAVYWLARMLESGEDPRFIARRLVIFASEDVGNADPQALLVANAAWDAVERVGLPECQLNLSQAVCYLATAPKSNACDGGDRDGGEGREGGPHAAGAEAPARLALPGGEAVRPRRRLPVRPRLRRRLGGSGVRARRTRSTTTRPTAARRGEDTGSGSTELRKRRKGERPASAGRW